MLGISVGIVSSWTLYIIKGLFITTTTTTTISSIPSILMIVVVVVG